MQSEPEKTWKVRLVKHIALLMSICYLINPLQQQVKVVLHELSHGFELPDYVMAHESDSHSVFETHTNHTNHDTSLNHEHTLIDFISTIFHKSNESNNSKDSQLSEIKWDKHITSYCSKLPPNFEILIDEKFYLPEQVLRQRQSERLERPPRNSAS